MRPGTLHQGPIAFLLPLPPDSTARLQADGWVKLVSSQPVTGRTVVGAERSEGGWRAGSAAEYATSNAVEWGPARQLDQAVGSLATRLAGSAPPGWRQTLRVLR
jgi:hypothetical protein